MIITVKATPKSKFNSVKKISDTEYHIHTTSAPDKNKANTAVIKLLSQELNISKSHIQIIKGKTSRHKTIEIFPQQKTVS